MQQLRVGRAGPRRAWPWQDNAGPGERGPCPPGPLPVARPARLDRRPTAMSTRKGTDQAGPTEGGEAAPPRAARPRPPWHGGTLATVVRRIPFTTAVVLLVLAVGIATGALWTPV